MTDEKHELPPFKPKDEIEEAMFNALVEAGNVEQIKYDLLIKKIDRAYNRAKKQREQELKLMNETGEKNLVKRACLELGLTQKGLAETMGVHPNMPAKWSSGDTPSQMAINFMELLIKYNKLKNELIQLRNSLSVLNSIK